MITIVGSGIAGSLAARMLRKRGHRVVVVDDSDPFSASRASSNLYIDHWLKKFGSDARAGIEVIEDLFRGRISSPFEKGVADALRVRHVSQDDLLVKPDIQGQVTGWTRNLFTNEVTGVTVTEPGRMRNIEGPVVLCCGWRGNELSRRANPGLEVLVGHCLLVKGKLPPGASSITMPLPYRHQKLYQVSANTIYFADSTRLSFRSWQRRKDELVKQLLQRGEKALAEAGLRLPDLPFEHRVGYRPCTSNAPFGELREVEKNVWSINGGGKNGMVAYANLARKLTELVGAP